MDERGSVNMQESIDKVKGAAAIIQNMVSTDEEVVYNDLAFFNCQATVWSDWWVGRIAK